MNEYLISLFEQQWKDDPKSRVFLRLAEEYRKGTAYEKAVDVCLKGVAHHPNYAPALVCLGRCQLELGRLDESANAFQKVLSLVPDNPHAIRAMANIHHKSGRFEEARSFCELLLIQEPGDEDALQILEDIRQAGELETQPSHVMDTEPMKEVVSEEPEIEDNSFSEDSNITDSFEADMVEVPDEELVIPPASSVDLETGPLDPFDDDSAPVITFESIGEDFGPQHVIEALDTEPVDDISEHVVPLNIPGQQLADHMDVEDISSAEEPALDGMDDIDLQFEMAMKDDEKSIPIFPDEPANKSAPPLEQTLSEVDAPSQSLTGEDDALITLGLKHERMMHFEETAGILKRLLDKYPRDPSVRQHLERVNQLMESESRSNKKIRLLSNWLDKIKGVYYVC